MLDLATLTVFLGWSTLLNFAVLIFAAFFVVVFNAQIRTIHSKLIPLESRGLNALYFSFLGRYKLAILVLNLVPYWALKIMA